MYKRPYKTIIFSLILLLMTYNSCQRYNDEDDFIIKLSDDKKRVIITGYEGTSKDVRIPPRIKELPVRRIGEEAFKDKKLTSVIIPKGVNTIGDRAFYTNYDLTSVTISNSVTVIGYEAFAFNRQLTSVIIPNSVTHIGGRAFLCNGLTHVVIPDSVIEIGEGAFADNNLTSIHIPDSITFIRGGVFANNKLTSITIPENIVSIWDNAFADNKLTEITIPKNVTSIGGGAFLHNDLTRITIGENVELNYAAFAGFAYFYNDAVDKRGGTYIFGNYHWSPEEKTIPILKFTSYMTGKFPDIAFLTDMPDLEEVLLYDNELLIDITPLSELTKLKFLHIERCPNIESLEPLSSLTNLKTLILEHNDNYDYSALVPLRQ